MAVECGSNPQAETLPIPPTRAASMGLPEHLHAGNLRPLHLRPGNMLRPPYRRWSPAKRPGIVHRRLGDRLNRHSARVEIRVHMRCQTGAQRHQRGDQQGTVFRAANAWQTVVPKENNAGKTPSLTPSGRPFLARRMTLGSTRTRGENPTLGRLARGQPQAENDAATHAADDPRSSIYAQRRASPGPVTRPVFGD